MNTIEVRLTPTTIALDVGRPQVQITPAGGVTVALGAVVGPRGPEGPRGPAGTSTNAAYLHTQSNPAAVWTIQHGLGFRAVPLVRDVDDRVTFGWEIAWESPDVLIITFPHPIAGTAALS